MSQPYSHARTASDIQTSLLLGLPEQSLNPPPSPSLDSHGFALIGGQGDEPAREAWERKMGPNEVSYFLPSRAEGVNDMYLHLKLFCPPQILAPSRVLLVWALLRLRHPLLASRVEVRQLDDIYFVYELPRTTAEAVLAAKGAASFPEGKTKDELVDSYLNGPRTLSPSLLAKVLISRPPPSSTAPDIFPNPSSPFTAQDPTNEHFEFMFFAGHFLGDGVSFAVLANEFMTLCASDMAEEDLSVLVQTEIDARVAAGANPIPVSTEKRLAIPRSATAFQKAVAKVEFINNQAKQIGGQAFDRAPAEPGQKHRRQTFVDTRVFDPTTTKAILAMCKQHGVTIANAVFALVNIAWARRKRADNHLPLMMYSAINLRGALRPPKPAASSFFHLCVGYYNVVLPSFLIGGLTDEQTFWLRCQSTKRQTHRAVKSSFLVYRAMAMSLVREQQAIGWAKFDDAQAAAKAKAEAEGGKKKEEEGGSATSVVDTLAEGVDQLKLKAAQAFNGGRSGSGSASQGKEAAAADTTNVSAASAALGGQTTSASEQELRERQLAEQKAKAAGGAGRTVAPQTALMGVSFLGNLDAISNYTTYPQVHTSDLTFGVRQRPGGMLMFSYTFAGRLWFSLGWDLRGYPEGSIESFWNEVLEAVPEFLVEKPAEGPPEGFCM